MNKELKQDFTRRLSQCNRGEMIIIMYEIGFCYLEETKEQYETDHESFKQNIRRVIAVMDELIQALDFSYEISSDLYQIYSYCKKELFVAMSRNRTDEIEEVERLLKKLYASFLIVAKQDTSEPLMTNTQQVYAGITYQKNNLNENYIEIDAQRGFLA